MPICIECSYPVSQLYHVLHSRNHTKPPPLPPKPKPITAPSSLSKKTGSKSTGSLRGLHDSVKATFRSSDVRTSEEADNKKNEAAAAAAKSMPSKGGGGVGTDVRLMQCPRCKRFADKYVEHDFVVLFIDLVLVKPQVYRHLLFNRLHTSSDALDPSIIRLGVLLLLFDVYITWSHIEGLPPETTSHSKITDLPLLLQYLFFLFLCFSTSLSQHVTIRCLAGWTGLGGSGGEDEGINSQGSSPLMSVQQHQREGGGGGGGAAGVATPGPPPLAQAAPPKPATPNAISTALVVSSCMSLFPILMVVWRYDDSPTSSSADPPAPSAATLNSSSIGLATGFLSPSAGHGMDWVRTGVSMIVAVQNWEALRILLKCRYSSAAGLVLAGVVVRWSVRAVILGVVGLGEAG